MSQITLNVPSNMPPRIAKFELEQELERKSRRFESIKSAVHSLGMSKKDAAVFEKARELAWKKRKEELL